MGYWVAHENCGYLCHWCLASATSRASWSPEVGQDLGTLWRMTWHTCSKHTARAKELIEALHGQYCDSKCGAYDRPLCKWHAETFGKLQAAADANELCQLLAFEDRALREVWQTEAEGRQPQWGAPTPRGELPTSAVGKLPAPWTYWFGS